VGKKIKDLVNTGTLGIGFDINEALVSEGGPVRPNLISAFVATGAISTRAYSLWLNKFGWFKAQLTFTIFH
jgi:hypothetical protein